MSRDTISTHRPYFVAISIPGSATAPASCKLIDLINAANPGKVLRNTPQIVIDKNQPAVTTDRAAFIAACPRQDLDIAAGDFTTHGKFVEAGEELNIPSEQVGNLFVRSSTTSAVPALVVVL